MAKKKAKSRVISVDFSNVEDSGGGFKIPEGSYRMKVTEVVEGESSAGNDMLTWTFEGLEKKAKGKAFKFYTPLNEESLWKLRGLLIALGQDIPKEPNDIDLDEMIDLELVGIVTDEEYKNKISSKMTDFEGAEAEEAEEEEEEEKPSKKGAKAPKKSKELDKIAGSEVKAMDEDELADIVKKYKLEVDLDEYKTVRRKASAVVAELEEKDLLEDE